MPSAAYASNPEYVAYAESTGLSDWTTTDETTLTKLLERASRDIDSVVGVWEVNATTGFKFRDATASYIDELEAWQVEALVRATCAQATYRLEMGDQFFIRPQYESTTGPDFSLSGTLPRIGPEVWAELRGSGLVRLTTKLGGRGSRPPWWNFAYNVEDD